MCTDEFESGPRRDPEELVEHAKAILNSRSACLEKQRRTASPERLKEIADEQEAIERRLEEIVVLQMGNLDSADLTVLGEPIATAVVRRSRTTRDGLWLESEDRGRVIQCSCGEVGDAVPEIEYQITAGPFQPYIDMTIEKLERTTLFAVRAGRLRAERRRAAEGPQGQEGRADTQPATGGQAMRRDAPRDIRTLNELAATAHRLWCEAKLADGWRYDDEYNPYKKTHDALVPYDQLSEVDRRSARIGIECAEIIDMLPISIDYARGANRDFTEDELFIGMRVVLCPKSEPPDPVPPEDIGEVVDWVMREDELEAIIVQWKDGEKVDYAANSGELARLDELEPPDAPAT
jgi:hypothetical protein